MISGRKRLKSKFSDDGKLIATSSVDNIARTWSSSDGSPLQEFTDHNKESQASHSPPTPASGTFRSGHCILTLIGDENSHVSFVKFSLNEKFILVGMLDSTLVR
ncbi:hypothetical protein SSX86_010044 [Deinandra increscens subsp. villosa]|uniref:Uncharacterized protein n=1 Tax=Deinandra increscens subsp. villosa TaxID=3103831 RepID=A0AAP0H6B3_9ASTR